MEESSSEELEELRQFAQRVFGSKRSADQWLDEYHCFLKKCPIEIAQTKEGLELINSILASLIYGGVA